MAKFIAIEGVDGSGKSTQIELLCQRLERNQVPYYFVHFPRLNRHPWGTLISEFLRGEFGSIEQVHPKLVALLYAQDRHEETSTWQKLLDEGVNVIVDRYVYSNIAYQTAKLSHIADREKLTNYILELEYDYFKIPSPDISIFLHAPLEFTLKNLAKREEQRDRDYLNGKSDIHEQSNDFQHAVYENYMRILQTRNDLELLECVNEKGEIHTPEYIHGKIWSKIESLFGDD